MVFLILSRTDRSIMAFRKSFVGREEDRTYLSGHMDFEFIQKVKSGCEDKKRGRVAARWYIHKLFDSAAR